LSSDRFDTTQKYFAQVSAGSAAVWIDEHVAPLEAEDVPLDEAFDRVLAHDVVATIEVPSWNRVSVDGLAVRAEETASASAYNPLSFRLAAAGDTLPPKAGILLSAGGQLPTGADAVVPLEYIEQNRAGSCDVIEAVPHGSGVERKGSQFVPGTTLVSAGRVLHPLDIGLLAAAEVALIPVVRRPRVRCLLISRTVSEPGSPAGIRGDANAHLLQVLVQRDGGMIIELRQIERHGVAVREALMAMVADLTIVVGGTGPGSDDVSATGLAEVGQLAAHGVALTPGETAGFGLIDTNVPVFLLPGPTVACFWAYEFLAGRAVRHLAGRDQALPYRTRDITTARKIVSGIGATEIHPVRRLSPDRVEPVASFASAGLGSATLADGFVVIPEGCEGYPEGAIITVYWFDDRDRSPTNQDGNKQP
jgi:molybdopterin molybdotransferase